MHRAGGSAAGSASPLTVLQYRVTPNCFDVAGMRFIRGTGWSDDSASADRRSCSTNRPRACSSTTRIGVPIAWWFSRGFASLLFQVTPADVSVYAGAAGLLIVVGLLAAWIPARRDSRIDPIVSLRH